MKSSLVLVAFISSLFCFPRAAWSLPSDDALSDYNDVRNSILAGVRSVGNAGGYAEMQALFINQRLSEWLPSVPAMIQLEIDPTCGRDPIIILAKDHAKIAACALYSRDQTSGFAKAKSFAEIAIWVLTARLVSNGTSFQTAFGVATGEFRNFSQSEESVEVNLTTGVFVYHDLSVQAAGAREKIISLEGKSKSYDVTSQTKAILRCPGDAAVIEWSTRDSATRAIGAKQSQIISTVEWRCRDQSEWKATLQISFVTQANEILENTITAQVVQKIRMRP